MLTANCAIAVESLMRQSLICLLLLISLPALAQIYKYTDANGNTAFSNQPPNGTKTEVVELPPLNSIEKQTPARPVVNSAPQPAPAQPQPQSQLQTAYDVLELTDLPTDEALRANNGTFIIGVKIQPRLQPTHSLQLLLDGNLYGQPSNLPRFQVVNIDRGEHSFAVVVKDGERIIQQSETITLTIQRVHLGKP
ncbi:DUF4124 domain-containing protein [Pseudomonas amygdali pv. lachrymans]|uniref:DUF4124 domain-containing protein n=2 Tax=Pseudomonas amygdali pv. lachrymans TaxID=53707 RepID=A0AB37RFY8_PSEAV|nr:DUF4124 domain-containing protein [Pseudomonas amygdali]KKY57244.1 hypothetical protein AAY85_15865 [Pseudomonas amygdali pv. lachrymans]KPC01444.1 Uncharacterized protein AC501_5783 [Pseudomonas amygdali pv. lachrymans]KPC22800.1 Uncharacterized protein AC499_3654 [Pseudomonas amygdali pv. lachrymans]QWA50006.1 DUF4124 domain-containing protein [Pseudomonas amygdali pv. lachrymans]RMM42898.1 hypothetical protein ALQ79_03680 [Pseudomonas amygdali pv. lachrymans]